MQRVGVLNDAARSRQLRDLLQSGLTAFTALDSLEDYRASVRGFKSSVVDALWQISAQTKEADFSATTHYTSARTLRIFRRARDYIHRGLADGISIVALCKETGVSRRSMECVFRSVIGIGPANYIRVLQLNHIRRDLLSGADTDVPIGMIAARHGMWHWSRFSRYYRLLFGELPSDTRTGPARRGAPGRPARRRQVESA